MKLFRSLLAITLVFFLSVPLWADAGLIDRALKAFNQKDYPKANMLIDRHLANNPEDDQAQYAKAMVLFRMGYFAKAMARCETVLLLSPKNHLAKSLYAASLQQEVYRLINKSALDEALAACDKAIAFLPHEPGIHYAKGVALFERWCQNDTAEDHAQALKSWEIERNSSPVSATAEILSGIYAFDGYNYQRAYDHFTVALNLRRNHPYAALWKGLASTALGNYDEAIKYLSEAKKTFSRNPSIHLYIADVYRAQGKYTEAKQEYLEALKLKPNDNKANAALKELYLSTGNVNAAVNDYTENIRANPSSYADRFRLASLLHEAGLTSEALDEYDRCLQLDITPKQKADVCLEKAIIHLENNQPDKVAAALNEQDRRICESSKNPRYCIYTAYTSTSLAGRESAVRKALTYSGADSVWLHAEAFSAWAQLEVERKQYLKAMELIYQAWRRTPASSPKISKLQKLFEEAKSQDLAESAAALKSAESLREKDPFTYTKTSGKLQNRLKIVQTLDLGQPGGMLSIAAGGDDKVLIPASLDANMPHSITTLVAPSSWMHVTKQWQAE